MGQQQECYIQQTGWCVGFDGEFNIKLYDFDFFASISDDILNLTDKGLLFITGDLNSRTGTDLDFTENIGLDRFVDTPPLVSQQRKSQPKNNFDKFTNNFGKQLLTLCKQHDVQIVNGRLDNGDFTCLSNDLLVGSDHSSGR